MAADYRIDRIRECVFSNASGFLTDEDLLGHQRRLMRDADFRSHLNQLWDLHDLDRIDISANAIRTLARNNPFGNGSRRALVVDSPLSYGLARMFQVYADESPDEVEIFKDHGTAIDWLEAGETSN